MEEGVVSELLRSPLGEVFDHQQLITDVSGSGNNWYGDIVLAPCSRIQCVLKGRWIPTIW